MKKKLTGLLLACFIGLLMLSACGGEEIYLPKYAYQVLPDTFPYSFVFSKYANLSRDTFPSAGRYYIDLYYPGYDAVIQITYKNLKTPGLDVERLLNDAFGLTMKHTPKAYDIQENIIAIRNGQKASVTELSGEVPSQFQFFTTDTTQHFFRGALYFNTATQNDSLAPVIDFIKKDIIEMLNSLEWKY